MGFLDGLLGKKRDKTFDWLELGQGALSPAWTEVGVDDDGMECSIERLSCFRDGDIVWWKGRLGEPGRAFDYLICAASIQTRGIMIPICRTLSDPGLELVKPDILKQKIPADALPLLDQSLSQAAIWGAFNSYSSIPPYVFYGMGIMKG